MSQEEVVRKWEISSMGVLLGVSAADARSKENKALTMLKGVFTDMNHIISIRLSILSSGNLLFMNGR